MEDICLKKKENFLLIEKFYGDVYSISPWEIILLVNYPEC